MSNKSFTKTIPLAAALTAALMLGGFAQAQTTNSGGSAAIGTTATPGSTNKKDNVMPEPGAGNGATGRAGASANTSSGGAASMGAMGTPGTTNKKDNVSPEPSAGRMGSTGSAAAVVPGTTDLTPAASNQTGIGGTTNQKNNVSPSPSAGNGMDASARKQAKANKKAQKKVKPMARQSSDGMATGGDASITTPSPSK